jgi:oligopeptide transport system permease protein
MSSPDLVMPRPSSAIVLPSAVLALIGLACIAGPWLLPHAGDVSRWEALSAPPGLASGHWLGTDAIGRDVLARTLEGGRVSLAVGAVGALAALVVGLGYGAIAGTAGGWVERVMMRALDVLAALPFLLIVVLLLTVAGRSLPLLLAAVAFAVWTDLARVARAEAARLRSAPFVVAARAAGAGFGYIVLRHVLPQLLPLGLVWAGLLVPQAILVESFLGFLGLSIDEPAASWGSLLAEGVQEMLDAPWVLLAPALMLAATLLAASALSDALRDRYDPRRGRA